MGNAENRRSTRGPRRLTITSTLAPVTYVNLVDYAPAAGTVNKASVDWSVACSNAFKIVFLRTGFSTNSSFSVVAVRGPFNAIAGRNDVTLSPPVTLPLGDLIGVVQMQPSNTCGTVRIMDYGGGTGYSLITVSDLSTSGLGSLDVVTNGGAQPIVSARVFSDGGAAGTTGFFEEGVLPADAIDAFRRGILLTPEDPANFRMNIGVRTLDSGATLNIAVLDASGNLVGTRTATYPANYFEQAPFAVFTGVSTMPAGGRISIGVNYPGTVIAYSSVVDNRTSDSTFRLADIK